jgi:dTDP-4-dehydrorhamnose 3,5-epimerase
MDVLKTEIDGVLVIAPKAFDDQRGFFMETFHRRRYEEAGIVTDFCQDNLSFSCRNTLRGLHYQFPHGQAKLVQVLQGEILDVAVDIRRGSPTFGRGLGWRFRSTTGARCSSPKGFAHGFCVLSETALFIYKCSDFYAPDCDRGVLWSDPSVGIEWPVKVPLLSTRMNACRSWKDIPPEQLPEYKA